MGSPFVPQSDHAAGNGLMFVFDVRVCHSEKFSDEVAARDETAAAAVRMAIQ